MPKTPKQQIKKVLGRNNRSFRITDGAVTAVPMASILSRVGVPGLCALHQAVNEARGGIGSGEQRAGGVE